MTKLLLYIFLILFPIIATSHASSIQLPSTGQAVSLAGGDDGATRIGKPWPAPRFIDNRNGMISDNLTGLVWSANAAPLAVTYGSSGAVTWQKALDEIKRLNAEMYLGYNDWRLPNLNELASLLHQGESVHQEWLVRQGFSNITAAHYWSSGSVALATDKAWVVHMADLSITALTKNSNAYLWPVRGLSGTIPATGASACYDAAGLKIECSETGQDGELRMGVPWPLPRFADNGNATITDNLTGLIWPKDANPAIDARLARAGDGSPLWADVLEFVTDLNSNVYLGHNDWRLPNRVELVSLVNYTETLPGTNLNFSGVSDIQQHYWSSGSSAVTPANAWSVAMNGEVTERGKYDIRLGSSIWPVRGGIDAQQTDSAMSKVAAKTVAAVAATLSVTTTTLAGGTTGSAYSQTLAATGGTTPYTWTKSAGTLPAGLTLSTAGVISGTPTTAATSSFTVQVKDKAAKTATKSLSITVSAAPLAITTATLTDGYLTTAYSLTLAATGGKTAYSWSITTGTLPTGLTLAATTGVISGTPATATSSAITVQVKDANNTIVTKALTITVYALPAITTVTLPAGNVSVPYNQTLAGSGGKPPVVWSVSSGTLPAGLTLAAATGVISGTPTTAATSSVTFKITDANTKAATKAFSLVINVAPPSITTKTLADGYVGASYSQTLAATGGKAPYVWSRTLGSLPAGLSIGSGGVISGTPTTEGVSTFTMQVKDSSNSTATVQLSITIVPNISIANYTELPFGTLGVAYNQILSASGGKLPYSWSYTYEWAGPFPIDGLSLNSSAGTIAGIPRVTGNFRVAVTVTDANNMSAYSDVFLGIYSPVGITKSTLHNSYTGIAYYEIMAATGGLR